MAVDEYAMYLLLSNPKTMFMLPPFLDDCDQNMLQPLERCEAYLASRGAKPVLRGVTTQLKAKIERDCPGRYSFTPDRDNYEYVYSSQDLCTLQGKKYHSKRNHINKLTASHSFEYRRYTKEDYAACMELYQTWVQDSYKNEYHAVVDALTHFDTLGLVCGLLYVDGQLEAFSVGEKFGDDMAIIHIEKANQALQGAYALINREFVCHEWSELEYINREEDMGIEGLRKAKLSYNPVFLNEKYVGMRSY